MPPTPSLEDPPRPAPYNPDAPTQAMNLSAMPDLDDPFAARATEVEIPSFSSEEAARSVFSDDDVARVDLRPPARVEPSGFDLADAPEVVEISLSDMDPLSDEVDALPELADDDSDEDTHDTVVNMPLPASLRAEVPSLDTAPKAVAAPKKGAAPALAPATVVERRTYNPAALFDDDPASVTDPHRVEAPEPPAPRAALPGFADEGPSLTGAAEPEAREGEAASDAEPATPAEVVLDAAPPAAPPAVPAAPAAPAASARESAADRTAARPSLVSQPSGDPASASGVAPSPAAATPPSAAAPDAPNAEEAALPWQDESLLDGESEREDQTVAPDLSDVSDVSDDGGPPELHKWKVVPTAIRNLDRAPPPKPAGFASVGQAKALQTVLWSPEDEAAARAQQAAPRNPFWAPTDAALQADDGLESTEAAAPSDPRLAAAAYIHDAVAYLRSLSHFGAHLDEEVRHEFEGRMLGANDRLRRALAVLYDAVADAPPSADDEDDAEDDEG